MFLDLFSKLGYECYLVVLLLHLQVVRALALLLSPVLLLLVWFSIIAIYTKRSFLLTIDIDFFSSFHDGSKPLRELPMHKQYF